jgi:hypothetical protein
MSEKYVVTLTADERQKLLSIVKYGKTAGYRIRHAQILLALDEIPENAHWTEVRIAEAYHCTDRTVSSLRKRFVEGGLDAALERKKRETPPVIKIDGEKEALITVLACSEPPEGQARWTLRLLADKTVQLGIFDSISHTAIGNCLKKKKSNRGFRRNGVLGRRQRNM